MSYFADEDLYRRFEKQNYVLSFIYCHGICVYIFSSLSIARLMRRWSSCRRKFHGKGIKWKTFPNDYAASLCGVVVGCSRVESTVPGSNLTVLYIPFFSCLMHSFPPSFIYLFILSILLTLQTWGKLCLPQLQDRDPGGGDYSLEFLVGVYRLVFQSWPYLRLENVTFHTRFQIGPLRNYVIPVT